MKIDIFSPGEIAQTRSPAHPTHRLGGQAGSSGCVADAQLKLGVANDGVAKIKKTATVVSQHKRQTVRMGRFLMLPYARQTMDRR
jgi:hypothetical protein